MNFERPTVFQAHDSHINDLVFSPDGNFLLSAGMDNRVRLWSVPDWELSLELEGHQKSVNSLSLTARGERLVTASSDRTVREWSLEKGELHRQFAIKGSQARLSPDDRFVLAVDNPWVALMDYESGESRHRFKPFSKRTAAMAFSPDGRILALGGQGDDIRLFLLPELTPLRDLEQAHQGYVLSLAFSPDGRRLVSTGYEGQLRFWDASTWAPVEALSLSEEGVLSLVFSPDGHFLTVAADHSLILIDAEAMKAADMIRLDPKGVYCSAFSPDGRWLACGAADKRLRIWSFPPE
jgi:WD40 repeat protein